MKRLVSLAVCLMLCLGLLGTTTVEATQNLKIGTMITFGHYEQDNNSQNGKEEISWQVLALENSNVLLISEYGLDSKAYHDSTSDYSWENSSIHNWLNHSFLEAAFTQEEQQGILLSVIDNGAEDKVFLLNYEEAETYFNNDGERVCAPTDYAEASGAYTKNNNSKKSGWWWLRSPGKSAGKEYYVSVDGTIGSEQSSDMDIVMIRPAIWLAEETLLHILENQKCSKCDGTGIETANIKCDRCYGNGIYHYVGTCSMCNGSGKNKCTSCWGKGTGCIKCGGTGIETWFDYKVTLKDTTACKYCNGKGTYSVDSECSKCNGTGKYNEECTLCGGTGKANN